MSLVRRTPLRRTPMNQRSAKASAPEVIAALQKRIHPCIRRTSTAQDPEVRFWARVTSGAVPDRDPSLGPCLIHSGADNGNGYVQFTYNGRGDYAHRYAWERTHGPIPDNQTVDHLCEVKRCVNVDHFQLLTSVDNYRRTKLEKDACPNGHEYRSGSFQMRRGARECLICKRGAWRRGQSKRVRIANGLPDRRVTYDQGTVRRVIAEVRAAKTTIAQGARDIGCHPNYLGRRVWRETRVDVLARDNGRCARCGNEAADAHHRIARGTGSSSKPEIAFGMDNLIALCRTCHAWVHEHPTLARPFGWLLTRDLTPSIEPVQYADGTRRLLQADGTYTEETPA